MAAKDSFADYPELQAWREAIEGALLAFEAEVDSASSIGGEESLAHFINAYTRFLLALADVSGPIGISFTRDNVRSLLVNAWPTRQIVGGEARAISTRVAYAANVRLPESGSKDSRMEAAMLFTATLEGIGGSDPIAAIRKSIQRFRQSVRGTSVFVLDRETLTVERFDAESALTEGLPGKRGRPQGFRKSN